MVTGIYVKGDAFLYAWTFFETGARIRGTDKAGRPQIAAESDCNSQLLTVTFQMFNLTKLDR